MAETPNTVPLAGTESTLPPELMPPVADTNTSTNFLGNTPNASKAQDTIYEDFFHEGEDGKLTVWTKSSRSGLEIFVNIMKYVVILVVIVWALFTAHVSLRTIKDASIFESYPFLCSYLNYDVNTPEKDKQCKTVATIQSDFDKKTKVLKDDIVAGLSEYIPVQVGANILSTSPERLFAVTSYESKSHIDTVLSSFEKTKKSAQYQSLENIDCTGVVVRQWNALSTQCSVYGGNIGDTSDSTANGGVPGLASSRIEALRFLEILADTSKSSFVLDNPPTSLSIEKLSKEEWIKTGFQTRTTIPVQVRYVPLIQKP